MQRATRSRLTAATCRHELKTAAQGGCNSCCHICIAKTSTVVATVAATFVLLQGYGGTNKFGGLRQEGDLREDKGRQA